MEKKSSNKDLVKWRELFASANTDILDIIEHAIIIAAIDCPDELKLRRDGIAELLFTRRHKLEIQEEEEKKDDDADADASQVFGEVMRIKKVLDNGEKECDELLYNSLERLQLMGVTVEVLKETEIGKSVNALRRHESREIRQLAKTLVHGWVAAVDEWMNALNDASPSQRSDLAHEEAKPSQLPDDGKPQNSQQTQQNDSDKDVARFEASKRKLHEVEKAKKQDIHKQNVDEALRKREREVKKREAAAKNDSDEYVAKLESSKRKLQEGYQEVEKAKRQRTVQVIDNPKQNLVHRARSGNRHMPTGCR